MAGDVDGTDVVLAALYIFSAAASIGVMNVELLDTDLMEVIQEMGPLVLDYATAISAVVWIIAVARSTPDVGKLSQEARLVILVAIGLVVYGAYEPAGVVERGSELIGLVAIALASGGYWLTVTAPERN